MHRRSPDVALADQVDEYFTLAATVDAVTPRVAPGGFHRLYLEDLVDDTRRELAALCRFLDVAATDDYLAACAAIVFESPRRTRDGAPWTPALRADVERRMARHAWLAGYTFD
jgi:hypothetical protein